MLDATFQSVFSASESAASSVSVSAFLLCCLASLALGVACAFIYMYRHDYSKNFVVTLALLPLVVQTVITLVNGNLGVGVAVMGVFSLVRFRSIAGTAKDIGSVFAAMAVGLACGMGYITLAVLFCAILAVASVGFAASPFGEKKEPGKTLRITVPEDLDYVGVFEPTLEKYARSYELAQVETVNMGSLFKLEYEVHLASPENEKRLLDELRCLNGNLKISIGRMSQNRSTL